MIGGGKPHLMLGLYVGWWTVECIFQVVRQLHSVGPAHPQKCFAINVAVAIFILNKLFGPQAFWVHLQTKIIPSECSLKILVLNLWLTFPSILNTSPASRSAFKTDLLNSATYAKVAFTTRCRWESSGVQFHRRLLWSQKQLTCCLRTAKPDALSAFVFRKISGIETHKLSPQLINHGLCYLPFG